MGRIQPNPYGKLIPVTMADLVLVREKAGDCYAHSETTPSPERFGTNHRDSHGVWLFTITAVLLAAVFITAWLLTSIGGNAAATFAAALVSIVVFLVVVAAIRVMADGQTFRTLCSLIVTVVVCASIVWASGTGALLGLKVQSSEGAWTHAALCALEYRTNTAWSGYSGSPPPNGPCAGVQSGRLILPKIGRVERITVYSDIPQVVFQGAVSVLIYSPNSGQVGQDACVGHITGPWWQSGGDAQSGCPIGLRFAPGP